MGCERSFAPILFLSAHPEKPVHPYEKCYGIAEAGKNDCVAVKMTAPKPGSTFPPSFCERIVRGKPRLDAR